jgi:UDP-N-acetylglucosamine--N-acetylmuramyl-(pentapeptide) pyrophosphoryl-undecaprenol N-acetylglucosamine transferase
LIHFLIIKAFFQSLFLLKKIKPDLVVSFGGYVSVPVIVAAKILHLKSITHEQTLTVSFSTKVNSYFVNIIALSFPYNDTIPLPLKKIVVTGNLIRREIFNYLNSKYADLIPHTQPLIYITGGNQGSFFINNLIFQLLGQLKHYSLIHQTGVNNYADATKFCSQYPNYFPSAYIAAPDIGWVFHHADLIISRAGANTCQEIDLLNKKAILIPLPGTQQNEQLLNARWLNSDHPQSTITLSQETLTPQLLLATAKKLLKVKSTTQTQTQTSTMLHPLVKLIHEMV